MPSLPSWYPDDSENKPAPMPLLRVQAFVNTRDLDAGSDQLAEAGPARAWLLDAGLIGEDAPLSTADLIEAQAVREAIRCLLTANVEGEAVNPTDLAPLRRLAAVGAARLTVDDAGALDVECAGTEGLADGLFELLLIIRAAQEDGTWARLKACANDECEWAFYDRSRNQQGTWCSMAVCGNRLKNRQLRARRR